MRQQRPYLLQKIAGRDDKLSEARAAIQTLESRNRRGGAAIGFFVKLLLYIGQAGQ